MHPQRAGIDANSDIRDGSCTRHEPQRYWEAWYHWAPQICWLFSWIDWSLESLFDRQLKNACPLAKESKVLVDLVNAGDHYELKPEATQFEDNKVAVYHLSKHVQQAPLDIRMTWQQDSFLYRKCGFWTLAVVTFVLTVMMFDSIGAYSTHDLCWTILYWIRSGKRRVEDYHS